MSAGQHDAEFENPVRDEGSPTTRRAAAEPQDAAAGEMVALDGKQLLSELEKTLKGLKDGALSEQQAAAVLKRLMDSRVDDGIDRLRKELATGVVGETLLRPLIQKVFAHMTEAPTNVSHEELAQTRDR